MTSIRVTCGCLAGDIQAPGTQETGKEADAAQKVSTADQESLLQFLRMMRKGKVGDRNLYEHALVFISEKSMRHQAFTPAGSDRASVWLTNTPCKGPSMMRDR